MLAKSGRPGPVLIDMPVDISKAEFEYKFPDSVTIQGYKPTYKGNAKQIKQAAKMLTKAQKPIIYAGGGIASSDASDELKELAEITNIPVTTTMLGKGAFPDEHPLSLRMLGMHGTRYANYSIMDSDVIFAVGVRFDDRVTGKVSSFAPNAKIIHVDIDPAEISKNVRVDLPIVGDAKIVLKELVEAVKKVEDPHADKTAWHNRIAEWKKKYPFHYHQENEIRAEYVIEKISELTKDRDTIITTGVGQNQLWAAQFYNANKPRSYVTSGGLGTMGFGLPAAVGAQFGRPDAVVVDIDGDGSIQMVSQEFATIAANKLPIITVILNNGFLGNVRQWQELFYNHRYSHVDLAGGSPDFIKLADAYGIKGVRVTKIEDVEGAIRDAIEAREPIVLEFKVTREANVFPMVAPGSSIDEMLGGIPGAGLDQMIDEEGYEGEEESAAKEGGQ
jgi:acetolactate synthase-1/2/3 large subunit